jgi:hypothetical protein
LFPDMILRQWNLLSLSQMGPPAAVSFTSWAPGGSWKFYNLLGHTLSLFMTACPGHLLSFSDTMVVCPRLHELWLLLIFKSLWVPESLIVGSLSR